MSITVECVQDRVPVGFKFIPTDSELVTQYLLKKLQQEKAEDSIFLCHRIKEIEFYDYTPAQLEATYKVPGEKMTHFFSKRKMTSRLRFVAGNSGFWKKTGASANIYDGVGSGWTGFKESFRFFQRSEGPTTWLMEECTIVFIEKLSAISGPGDQTATAKTKEWVIHKIYEIGNNRNIDEDPLKDIQFINSGFNIFEHPIVQPATSVDEYLDSLPAGFRFSPSDKELVVDYLRRKVFNQPLPCDLIHEDHVYRYHPKQLVDPEFYKPKRGETCWYFFTTANGDMLKQSLGCCHWKRGRVQTVVNFNEESGGEMVVVSGLRTTLTFFENENNANWKMHHTTAGSCAKYSKSKDQDSGSRSSSGHSAFSRFPDYFYSHH
ncbi:hypothetical protein FNV43_RR16029 [Rhamnella rubrinervis]|uniref:NAC domain-containing protein n=1 Tax=Rhamnella rubrinervis TaxID=2594499 RepID=A0A8K0E8Y9_9ROSA|nr:hypothetical protein FNV43_RR16029 [Rhamnella rubrinervis]